MPRTMATSLAVHPPTMAGDRDPTTMTTEHDRELARTRSRLIRHILKRANANNDDSGPSVHPHFDAAHTHAHDPTHSHSHSTGHHGHHGHPHSHSHKRSHSRSRSHSHSTDPSSHYLSSSSHRSHAPPPPLTRPDGPPVPPPHPSKPSEPKIPLCTHWRDYYPLAPLDEETVLPKPPSKIRYYSTKWKRDNPNPKTREGAKAYYGPGGMGGMGMGYPGMMGMGGMGMGYPGMMGMGMMPGGMGMSYGMPRYMPGGLYGGMGGYGAYGGMYDPMMGYGAPPAAHFVDDNPDAHRIEHAYRQSMPDQYGIGLGMMGGLGGGMGINNMPGSQMLLYGRGMGYGGWYN